jgi:O-antigen/teichoic acid export membrane protein
MLQKLVRSFKKILYNQSNITVIVAKNISGSFFLKGLSIAMSLYLIPYTIHMLDKEQYGIWLTIYSVILWFNILDVGLGYGFRNEFTHSVTLGNKLLAKRYVQALYFSMAILCLLFFLIYFFLHQFIDWTILLNTKNISKNNLNNTVFWIFFLFFIQLFLKNISAILLSLHKSFLNDLMLFASNFLSLVGVMLLNKFCEPDLFNISMTFMLAPILTFSLFSYYLFGGALKQYSLTDFEVPKLKLIKKMMDFGLKFFFIQITTIVLFSSSNMMVTQFFGPAEVTTYNIAYRMYSPMQTSLAVVMTPFLAAFTQASANGDIVWIKKSMKLLMFLWMGFSVCVIFLWIGTPYLVKLWLGDSVFVSYQLSLQFAIFTIIMGWNSPFVYYITGVGKIKLEVFIGLVQCILTLPLAFFLVKQIGLGSWGVIMATNLMLLIPAVLMPIQYKKLITNKAFGIWNR